MRQGYSGKPLWVRFLNGSARGVTALSVGGRPSADYFKLDSANCHLLNSMRRPLSLGVPEFPATCAASRWRVSKEPRPAARAMNKKVLIRSSNEARGRTQRTIIFTFTSFTARLMLMRFWQLLRRVLLLSVVLIQTELASAQEPVRSPESQELGRSWDPAYLEDKPGFNVKPNAFLVEIVKKSSPVMHLTWAWDRGVSPCSLPSKAGTSRALTCRRSPWLKPESKL
jgi:hypothetical protein